MREGLTDDSVQDVYKEVELFLVVVAAKAEESVDSVPVDEDEGVPDGVVVYLVEMFEVSD
jgi:hypothetical protein